MTKRALYSLLLLVMLLIPMSGLAQSSIATIETLTVAFWPDYDRAAVLVLLTGTLPEDSALPATVTIPLPAQAELNAVARVDPGDGRMIDITEFSVGEREVTFTTPDPSFRVEYYFPYAADGNQREFSYTWLSELTVNQINISIQQPSAATSLLTEPSGFSLIAGQDGFTYHSLTGPSVPAGQPFSVQVSYIMSRSELSAQRSGPSLTDAQTTGFSPTPASDGNIDWPLIGVAAGGLVVVIVLTWQIATARASSRPRKPRPAARAQRQQAPARYCHICGQPLQQGDKFCRECGTAVKPN